MNPVFEHITNDEIGVGFENSELRDYEDSINSMADLPLDELIALKESCES